MKHPAVSVVIPTYNREDLLKKCLGAVIAQSYPKSDYEIVVVDDGSTDRTEEVVMSIAKTTSNLKYIRQAHKGPAAARNLGIKEGRGEIVAFIDDDCIADKKWLESLVQCFSKDDKLAGVEGKVIAEGKTPFTHQVENLKGNFYLTANIAYKKKVLLETGLFDEGFPYPASEDWDLAFKILKRGEKIKFCERAVVVHPSRELSLKQWLKSTWIQWATVDRLYQRHKELWKKTTGHTLMRSFFDGVFLYFFVFSKRWRNYLISNPRKLPKFIVFYILQSLIIAFFAVRYLINLSKNLITGRG